MKPFNNKGSLQIDKWTLKKERGNWLARLVLFLLEWRYIG